MTEWKAKRFWQEATVVEEADGFGVALDGRLVRTPGKSPLRLPTERLATLVAEEWRAVREHIDPLVMPNTRMANSAIEKVAPQMDAVADHLAAYGETDLLCYRADGPEGLVARQEEVWGPWIAWAAQELGAPLNVTSGILPVEQPASSLAALRDGMRPMSAFQLAAFHDLVLLPGSLVLGYAAAREAASPSEIWEVSRLDELWQNAHWGEDADAARAAAAKGAAFGEAARFFAFAGL